MKEVKPEDFNGDPPRIQPTLKFVTPEARKIEELEREIVNLKKIIKALEAELPPEPVYAWDML